MKDAVALSLAIAALVVGCSRDSSPTITRDRNDRPLGEDATLTWLSPTTEDSASLNPCAGKLRAKLMLEEDDDFFEPGHVDLPHPCPDGMRPICVSFENHDGTKDRYGAICVAKHGSRFCEWHGNDWYCRK